MITGSNESASSVLPGSSTLRDRKGLQGMLKALRTPSELSTAVKTESVEIQPEPGRTRKLRNGQTSAKPKKEHGPNVQVSTWLMAGQGSIPGNVQTPVPFQGDPQHKIGMKPTAAGLQRILVALRRPAHVSLVISTRIPTRKISTWCRQKP